MWSITSASALTVSSKVWGLVLSGSQIITNLKNLNCIKYLQKRQCASTCAKVLCVQSPREDQVGEHACDDQADSEPINHVSYQVFSKQLKCTERQKNLDVNMHYKKRISTYLTPTGALSRPLYTHPALPSAIQERAYDAAAWDAEIIWRGGRRHWGRVDTRIEDRQRGGMRDYQKEQSESFEIPLLHTRLTVLKVKPRHNNQLHSRTPGQNEDVVLWSRSVFKKQPVSPQAQKQLQWPRMWVRCTVHLLIDTTETVVHDRAADTCVQSPPGRK